MARSAPRSLQGGQVALVFVMSWQEDASHDVTAERRLAQRSSSV